jgi:hypothetical protein
MQGRSTHLFYDGCAISVLCCVLRPPDCWAGFGRLQAADGCRQGVRLPSRPLDNGTVMPKRCLAAAGLPGLFCRRCSNGAAPPGHRSVKRRRQRFPRSRTPRLRSAGSLEGADSQRLIKKSTSKGDLPELLGIESPDCSKRVAADWVLLVFVCCCSVCFAVGEKTNAGCATAFRGCFADGQIPRPCHEPRALRQAGPLK